MDIIIQNRHRKQGWEGIEERWRVFSSFSPFQFFLIAGWNYRKLIYHIIIIIYYIIYIYIIHMYISFVTMSLTSLVFKSAGHQKGWPLRHDSNVGLAICTLWPHLVTWQGKEEGRSPMIGWDPKTEVAPSSRRRKKRKEKVSLGSDGAQLKPRLRVKEDEK